ALPIYLLPGDGDGGKGGGAGRRGRPKRLWGPRPAGQDGEPGPVLAQSGRDRHAFIGPGDDGGPSLVQAELSAVMGGPGVQGGERPVGVDPSRVGLVEEYAVEAHAGPAPGAFVGGAQLGLHAADLQG